MTTLTTEQQERVKALAGKHFSSAGTPFADELRQFAAALLSEFSAQDKTRITELEEEISIDDKLLAERQRVMSAIPPCPDHGCECVPHAVEWVEKAIIQLDVVPSLRVNPVAVTHLMITPEQGYRIYVDDAAEAERFRSMHGRSVQPLGVIMEADKVDELMELRAENAAYEEVATLMDAKSRMVNPAWVAEIVRALKSANAMRITEIEGKK